jgi:transcriptional regulator with XRE-family HTH domain
VSSFGSGVFLPTEVSERALVLAWITVHMHGQAAAELEALLKVPVDVIARRRAELGALVRGEQLEPADGWEWTREKIDAYVAGMNAGKASTPTLSQPEGPSTLLAEWPDSDWRAWKRHPQRADLWREVGADATATPAAPAPAKEAAAAAVPPPAAPTKALPPGTRPEPVEWEHAAVSRAIEAGPCAVCPQPIRFEDLVATLGDWSAHFHCARPADKRAAAAKPQGPADGVGAIVRELRRKGGVSQDSLAKTLKCKPSHVSKCELGTDGAEFTQEQLKDVAAFFGVPAATLAPPVLKGERGEKIETERTPLPARELFPSNPHDPDAGDDEPDFAGMEH